MKAHLNKHGMLIVRILVLLSLLVLAVVIGVGSYVVLHRMENESQKQQYYASTTKIESATKSAILDKQDALTTGLTLVLQFCPKESDWPYCGIKFSFYQAVLNPLHRITQTKSLSTAVAITPSQVSAFETFAYQFYADQGYPNVGVSSSERGIWAVDGSGTRYHDVNGTSGGGKYNILMPIFQVTNMLANEAALLFNTYSETKRSRAMDDAIDCIQRRVHASAINCTTITGMINLLQEKNGPVRPSSLTLLPIVPNNTLNVVGMVYAVHSWDTVLNLAGNEKVDGILAVLSDGTDHHSYVYESGQVKHIASKDIHDSKYDNQRVQFIATPFGGSTQFTVTLYPTDEWMDLFLDDVPLIACLVIIALVISTSLIFYLYDFLINREAVHKDLVMQTKRQYVRYISHEIRTPLNVVHLGFQVLYTEMTKILATQNTQTDQSVIVSTNDTSDGVEPSTATAPKPSLFQSISNFVFQIKEWITLVRDIVESLNSAISVLNDLIDYDKIDSDSLVLQREPLTVWQFVGSSVNPFIVQAKAKDIHMTVNLPHSPGSDDIVVLADRVKLSQVFRNLVSNALKFTPTSGSVTVEGRLEKHQIANEEVRAGQEVATPQPGHRKLPIRRQKSVKKARKQIKRDEFSSGYEEIGRVIITVTDTGAGMSEAQVQSLFREGVQFNPNDLQAGQGSGLGLWITKGIIDAHDGQLVASSEGVGCGTTFTLILPAFQSFAVVSDSVAPSTMEEGYSVVSHTDIEIGTDNAQTPINDSPTNELIRTRSDIHELSAIDLLVDSQQSRRFHNLLVTDDSAVNRKMMCRSLEAVGFKCFQAEDGQECLDIINKTLRNEHDSIDVILMDYEMPRMNGPTACASLRAMGCTIPVIGVTGNVLNEDKQLFIENGAVKVLQKPFSVVDLERVLQSLKS